MQSLILSVAGALLLLQNASAHEFKYDVVMSGSPSGGTGTGVVTLDMDLITMTVHLDYSGLTGAVTGSGIRCCTSAAGTGTAILAAPFADFPFGQTSGTYDALIDLTVADPYTSPFITASGGTVSDALNGLFFGLLDGKAYWSLETTSVPDGEIGGFLIGGAVPEEGTPEPATLLLTGGALAVLAGRRFFRRA